MIWIVLIFFAISCLVINYRVYLIIPDENKYSILGTLHVVSLMSCVATLFLLVMTLQNHKKALEDIRNNKLEYELIQEPVYKLK